MIGYKTSTDPSGPNDFTSNASWTVGANTVTTTNFKGFYSQATGTLATNIRILFYWIAIGPV